MLVAATVLSRHDRKTIQGHASLEGWAAVPGMAPRDEVSPRESEKGRRHGVCTWSSLGDKAQMDSEEDLTVEGTPVAGQGRDGH